jgi:hypothetical protein
MMSNIAACQVSSILVRALEPGPGSSFERAFLDYLYKNGLRLPDHGQHTPADGIPVQPDFYYERDGPST